MTTVIDATWGMWLVCAIIQPFLYGIAVLQAFLYFQWYPKDPWGNKLMVISLCILETLQLALYERGSYYYLVDGLTSPQNLAKLIWEDAAELLCLYLVATIVQGFFANTIWRLHKSQNKNITVVIVICVLGLVSIGAGIAQTIKVFKLSFWSELQSTKVVTSIQSAFSLGCDIFITISLCLALHSGRRDIQGVKGTNAMVNKLIIYAVNRGILTTVFQGLNLILFLALPNTFWFFLGVTLSSKLYMNSLLAALNSREYIRSSAVNNSTGLDSISTPLDTQLPQFAPNPYLQHASQKFSPDLSKPQTGDAFPLKYKQSSLVAS